jgi:hypothetical protein
MRASSGRPLENNSIKSKKYEGHVVAQLVEALRYKLERRRIDSRWCR